MNTNNSSPFLSVVVVSRNDNHGDNLNRRTQIFINSLFAQADRHEISMELVFVEWNPPHDKPSVKDAFIWPQNKFCTLKIITVPPEEHNKLAHSKGLPLFQMIGKNVGIKNASGEYILVTNIDVILSDEICKYIKHQLENKTIYRCDRWDADRDVPLSNDIDEILKYCETHIIRFQIPGKTIPANSSGCHNNSIKKEDLLIRDEKISLSMEISHRIECLFFDNLKNSFFRFKELKSKKELSFTFLLRGLLNWLKLLFTNFFHFYGALAGGIFGFIIFFLLFKSSFMKSIISLCIMAGISSLSTVLMGSILFAMTGSFLGSISAVIINRINNLLIYLKCVKLHTNGCGDFMLMNKEDWIKTKGYYNKPVFSWHLDSMFMFLTDALGIKCKILPKNCVIYHIEHGGGWTPETEKALFDRLDKQEIPYFTWKDLLKIERDIRKHKDNSLYFNSENWGALD